MKRDFRISLQKDTPSRVTPPDKLKILPTTAEAHEEPPPKSLRYEIVKHALIIIVGSGFLFVSAIVLTPVLGKVTGYANSQPPLRIIRPSGGEYADADSQRVLRLMRSLCAYRPGIEKDYWPVPAVIEEKEDCWLVTFAAKIPIYSFLGYEQTGTPSTPYIYVTVNKADYTVTFGKWCQ